MIHRSCRFHALTAGNLQQVIQTFHVASQPRHQDNTPATQLITISGVTQPHCWYQQTTVNHETNHSELKNLVHTRLWCRYLKFSYTIVSCHIKDAWAWDGHAVLWSMGVSLPWVMPAGGNFWHQVNRRFTRGILTSGFASGYFLCSCCDPCLQSLPHLRHGWQLHQKKTTLLSTRTMTVLQPMTPSPVG